MLNWAFRHWKKPYGAIPVRFFSLSNYVYNSYKQWPYEKIRRIGRRPSPFKGQSVGSRSRIPYDKRFPLSGKDINDTSEGLQRGGNEYMRQMIGRERSKLNSASIQYYDYEREEDVSQVIPEMIPEFVVPDLKDFNLKPYVSYRVAEEVHTQPKHTAAQLFKETYQKDILKDHRKDSS